jgi:hypothetical protein
MQTLGASLPEFVASLVRELEHDGYAELALTAPAAAIRRVTFDDVANAGYIYLQHQDVPPRESLVLETIPYSIVQLDGSGSLLGIEFLSPPRAFADKLRGLAVV